MTKPQPVMRMPLPLLSRLAARSKPPAAGAGVP